MPATGNAVKFRRLPTGLTRPIGKESKDEFIAFTLSVTLQADLQEVPLGGGYRFQGLLNRDLPPDEIFAESWELCDHGEDQSVVIDGPLAGESLGTLVARFHEELFGPVSEQNLKQNAKQNLKQSAPFPLLVKFIDAAKNLSLQVHPDDAMGATLHPPDSGKTEAWIVLDAEPGSKIYAGLKPGVTHDNLAQAIENGTTADLLHTFEARPGDSLFIPAGTVHAIGQGLLIAEIQQSSDTTFRLFDWNRVGPDGKPRPLHIEQGLKATKFGVDPPRVKRRRSITSKEEETDPFDYYDLLPGRSVGLVDCDKFSIDIFYVDDPSYLEVVGFRILIVAGGAIRVEGDPSDRPVRVGQTILLPTGKHRIVPIEPSLLIDAQLPKR